MGVGGGRVRGAHVRRYTEGRWFWCGCGGARALKPSQAAVGARATQLRPTRCVAAAAAACSRRPPARYLRPPNNRPQSRPTDTRYTPHTLVHHPTNTTTPPPPLSSTPTPPLHRLSLPLPPI